MECDVLLSCLGIEIFDDLGSFLVVERVADGHVVTNLMKIRSLNGPFLASQNALNGLLQDSNRGYWMMSEINSLPNKSKVYLANELGALKTIGEVLVFLSENARNYSFSHFKSVNLTP